MMNPTPNAPAGRTPEKVNAFVAGVQKIINDHYAANYPTLTPPVVEIDPNGKRYTRIVKREVNTDGRSVYCFIDENGDILFPAGWKAPAKSGARGNINDEHGGLSLVNDHGPVYKRGGRR